MTQSTIQKARQLRSVRGRKVAALRARMRQIEARLATIQAMGASDQMIFRQRPC